MVWKNFKNLGGGLLLMEIPLKTAWTSDKNLSKELDLLQCGQLNMHFTSNVRILFYWSLYLQWVVGVVWRG